MLEGARWLFGLLALFSLGISVPAPLAVSTSGTWVVTLAAAGVLAASLVAGYVRKTAPLVLDIVDAVAIFALSMTCPEPMAVFGVVFGLIWFRGLYGSTRRALLRCAGYATAALATLPLWTVVPGHTDPANVGSVIGTVPVMFLTILVGTELAENLRARERAAQRDWALARMGAELLGAVDRREIEGIGWQAITSLVQTTPGLRVVLVAADASALTVLEATGGFAHVPATLPADVVSAAEHPTAGVALTRTAELDAAVGSTLAWKGQRIPVSSDAVAAAELWMLVGAPRQVPTEVVVFLGNLANQVVLALRNSEVHQKLTAQAMRDSLTGLANRASFNAAICAALSPGSSPLPTVLFVDLDDFKDVNDVLGHGSGDQVLCEVAARLLGVTRPSDLCARLGGDEFAVLLGDTSGVAAATVARRIVEAVARPTHVTGGIARVGASVGVATASADNSFEQLIHRADVAMYTAKANGKGRYEIYEAGPLGADAAIAEPPALR